MPRARLRNLGLTIGRIPTGQFNAITDVPGALVGHTTLVHDEPRIARTGVTVVVPREGEIWNDNAFCGYFPFNGNGEMTGIPWIEESGMLGSIIGITNTHQVGLVRDALVEYAMNNGHAESWVLPVLAETYDGFLNDIDAFHLNKEHVFQAIASASSGVPAEGGVGGGTGMLCHDFKGGIGTSSRCAKIGMAVHRRKRWRDHGAPNHISKTVLSTVHFGPPSRDNYVNGQSEDHKETRRNQ